MTEEKKQMFDDGKPNYFERLKESFKNGNPIIEDLLPYVDKNICNIKRRI